MNKKLPPVIFGTSCLGNLYKRTSFEHKKEIVAACVKAMGNDLMFDTAGKYGAGMSLENLGACLKELKVAPEDVRISNKLGWLRIPLSGKEPAFEKGVWCGLEYDAVQKISYEGILECFYQAERLLGDYHADYVSVHDPDEYLNAADGPNDYVKRFHDILAAYEALGDLKKNGLVKHIGIGARDWRIIQMVSLFVKLDYVMIANSLTIHSHSAELFDFVRQLGDQNIPVINSAIFNGGFLTGGEFYNYQKIDAEDEQGAALLLWRKSFFSICNKYNILPEEACAVFSRQIYGIRSLALNATKPEKVITNLQLVNKKIHREFWAEISALQLS